MTPLRRNEWNFAANAAQHISQILGEREYSDSPLGHAEPELTELRGARRLDLVIFSREDPSKPLVTGELKAPWDIAGRTPYNSREMENAHRKATAAGALYFITWNICRVVVWKTDSPGKPLEQRVVYDDEIIPLSFRSFDEIGRRDIQDAFLAGVRRLVVFLHSLLTGPPIPTFLPLDRLFIANVEAALDFPIFATSLSIRNLIATNRRFRRAIEQWMRERQGWTVSSSTEEENIQRAARFSCYVLLNRLCFYNALRRKYSDLDRLKISNSTNTGQLLHKRLIQWFRRAEQFTGDYETVFHTDFGDELPFLSDEATGGWRALIRLLDHYDFSKIDLDVIGAMYEQLIHPEERHRYGQHYTQPSIVDLINAFTVHAGNAIILDPACGGGTFLVRAYVRKRYRDPEQHHFQLLEGIYGCDILSYACHLSTINLAIRDLIDDDNFPRIHLGDFLHLAPGSVFNRQPQRIQAGGLPEGVKDIRIEGNMFDAIIGNPPYIQARLMLENDRNSYREAAIDAWPNYPWRASSDIYVYFWMHAAKFLRQDGYIGLLTQAAWLDVDYGIPLQRWMLDNFRIVAILESEAEPWFTDARVATVVTILQREMNADERNRNLVKFVQFRSRLSKLLGELNDDKSRQQASEHLRDIINDAQSDVSTDNYQIRVVPQRQLYSDGFDERSAWVGSKWGRYLRSGQTLYSLQKDNRDSVVPLRDIAEIRRGTTTNCDDFFLVEDVSDKILEEGLTSREFKARYGIDKERVSSGDTAMIRRSDGYESPLERSYLLPILRNARSINCFATSKVETRDYVILFNDKRSKLSNLAQEYIRAGERERWHESPSFVDSTHDWFILRETAVFPILFVKTIQYAPVTLLNDGKLYANQRLYGVKPKPGVASTALCALLNSILFAAERYAAVKALGREAAIDAEVFTVNAFRVPDIRRFSPRDLDRLHELMNELTGRRIESLIEAHLSPLGHAAAVAYVERNPVNKRLWPGELRDPVRQEIDYILLKYLCVNTADIRRTAENLYNDLVSQIRKLRILELEAQINRRGSSNHTQPSPSQLADEIWSEMIARGIEPLQIPDAFIPDNCSTEVVTIPVAKTIDREEPTLFNATDMFVLRIGKHRVVVTSEEQLTFIMFLARNGVTGEIHVPTKPRDCLRVLGSIKSYLDEIVPLFKDGVSQITDIPSLQEKILHEGLKNVLPR